MKSIGRIIFAALPAATAVDKRIGSQILQMTPLNMSVPEPTLSGCPSMAEKFWPRAPTDCENTCAWLDEHPDAAKNWQAEIWATREAERCILCVGELMFNRQPQNLTGVERRFVDLYPLNDEPRWGCWNKNDLCATVFKSVGGVFTGDLVADEKAVAALLKYEPHGLLVNCVAPLNSIGTLPPDAKIQCQFNAGCAMEAAWKINGAKDENSILGKNLIDHFFSEHSQKTFCEKSQAKDFAKALSSTLQTGPNTDLCSSCLLVNGYHFAQNIMLTNKILDKCTKRCGYSKDSTVQELFSCFLQGHAECDKVVDLWLDATAESCGYGGKTKGKKLEKQIFTYYRTAINEILEHIS